MLSVVTLTLVVDFARTLMVWTPGGVSYTVTRDRDAYSVAPRAKVVTDQVLFLIQLNDRFTFALFVPFPELEEHDADCLKLQNVALRLRSFEGLVPLCDATLTWADIYRASSTSFVRILNVDVQGVGRRDSPFTKSLVARHRAPTGARKLCLIKGIPRDLLVSGDNAWIWNGEAFMTAGWFSARLVESMQILGHASLPQDMLPLLELMFLPVVGKVGASRRLPYVADINFEEPQSCDERTSVAYHQLMQLVFTEWQDRDLENLRRAVLTVGLPFVAQGASCGACNSCAGHSVALVPLGIFNRECRPLLGANVGASSYVTHLKPQSTLHGHVPPVRGARAALYCGNALELLDGVDGAGRKFKVSGESVPETTREETWIIKQCAGRMIERTAVVSAPRPDACEGCVVHPSEVHLLVGDHAAQEAQITRLQTLADGRGEDVDLRPFAGGWVLRTGCAVGWFS